MPTSPSERTRRSLSIAPGTGPGGAWTRRREKQAQRMGLQLKTLTAPEKGLQEVADERGHRGSRS